MLIDGRNKHLKIRRLSWIATIADRLTDIFYYRVNRILRIKDFLFINWFQQYWILYYLFLAIKKILHKTCVINHYIIIVNYLFLNKTSLQLLSFPLLFYHSRHFIHSTLTNPSTFKKKFNWTKSMKY